MTYTPGRQAIANRGWLAASKWLLARRATQLAIICLFLASPLAGVWILKGNLASSEVLGTLPLADPFVLVQSLFAGHVAETTAVTGALIASAFYVLVGGRAFCAWVCPVNILADTAHWARQKMGVRGGVRFSRSVRYWLLGLMLGLALMTGTLAWELINPVTLVFRGIVFGLGFAWAVALAVFLLELFVGPRAWCGHLCPHGAFYSLLGAISIARVSAAGRERCDDCMDCYAVCPEPQVITPALKGADTGHGPLILGPNCTNCGRCIDVCPQDVFRFRTRFHNRDDAAAPAAANTTEKDTREAA